MDWHKCHVSQNTWREGNCHFRPPRPSSSPPCTLAGERLPCLPDLVVPPRDRLRVPPPSSQASRRPYRTESSAAEAWSGLGRGGVARRGDGRRRPGLGRGGVARRGAGWGRPGLGRGGAARGWTAVAGVGTGQGGAAREWTAAAGAGMRHGGRGWGEDKEGRWRRWVHGLEKEEKGEKRKEKSLSH